MRLELGMKSPVSRYRAGRQVLPIGPEQGQERPTMNDIETKVGEILRDSNRLKRLLLLEKERRGVPRDALVFVGMADVAEYWWCPQQAVLTSRAGELDFFSAYLTDRITYAHRLGHITQLPRRNDALLEVGNGITPDDVEKLLRKEGRYLISALSSN